MLPLKNTKLCNLEVLGAFAGDDRCSFCKTSLNNTVCYGPIYKYEDVIVHYYCLLFSSNLLQGGDDNEGILGFLLKDIRKELTRGHRLSCTFCKKNGALIGCNVKSCKVKFHFPCGLENQVQNLYFDEFGSFCSDHRTVQYIPFSIRNMLETTSCSICLDKLPSSLIDIVWAPCCKTSLYHKKCIQEVAINSGYYFRCPNCNNEKLFRKRMLGVGIYIPNQDASWELEPNAYSSLLERYNHCDAPVCICPKGRNDSDVQGKWKIILCYCCLLKGIHKGCGRGIKGDQWTCPKQSCLNDSVPQGNPNLWNIRVPLSTYQSETQSSLLLSQTDTQDKENHDPNFNINETQPNYSSFHPKMVGTKATLRSSLPRQKIKICTQRRDSFPKRRAPKNYLFVDQLFPSSSKTLQGTFNSFPVTRSVLPSERNGRKKALDRIKQFINEAQHRKKKSQKLKKCKLSRNQSASKRARIKKEKTLKTHDLRAPNKRRRRYLFDQQVVRVYPTIFKSLKDFEICLSACCSV